jgi:hypothetical protein
MNYAVIKFNNNFIPKVWSITYIGDIDEILSMPSVEWAHVMGVTGIVVNNGDSIRARYPALKSLSPDVIILPAAANFPDVVEAVRDGKSIRAMKLYREYASCGLKEAKDAVDALVASMNNP